MKRRLYELLLWISSHPEIMLFLIKMAFFMH